MPYKLQSLHTSISLRANQWDNPVLITTDTDHAVIVHAFTIHKSSYQAVAPSHVPNDQYFIELSADHAPIITWPFNDNIVLGSPSLSSILFILEPNRHLGCGLKTMDAGVYLYATVTLAYGIIDVQQHKRLQTMVDDSMSQKYDGKIQSFLETI